ncbi:aspartate dehydrogenase [Herbaspirillum robiniae]|uniref:L-aspartate dehydrogenase n=1 Tax=Herbaspirillum robiniae TaxID=2014887 RepID=A0ABX2LWI7_9BURK|nr:aspartate dehydrogenase [Herbaspirillum robiniae]NUU01555.1 aspartate dehydrogenase [Herbaspirillum robiniae]
MKTVAIAGLGAIGHAVARGIDRGMDGIRLGAVSARDQDAARVRLDTLLHRPPLVPLPRIAAHADIVVECGGAGVLAEIAAPVLDAGKHLVVLSCGALLSSPELGLLAGRHRGRIHVPSGAIGGLDAVAAMAEGEIRSARLISRKPPIALRAIPWLEQRGIDLREVREPTLVFRGYAAQAARHFPANLNVAATLSLAGIGAQRTEVELWADPHARGNCHAIEVESDSGAMRFSIEATASGNPATSSLAAQSVLALLRRLGLPGA